jgi:hypothetical protein
MPFQRNRSILLGGLLSLALLAPAIAAEPEASKPLSSAPSLAAAEPGNGPPRQDVRTADARGAMLLPSAHHVASTRRRAAARSVSRLYASRPSAPSLILGVRF